MLKSTWNKICNWKSINVLLFSVTPSHTANYWKSLNHKIRHEKKMDPRNTQEKTFWTHETPSRKSFSTKYLWEKLWTYEITMRKNFNPQNTHEKKFWTHKIPTRKKFEPTKSRWHNDTRSTRPTMARDPQNLAYSSNDTQVDRLWTCGSLVIYV